MRYELTDGEWAALAVVFPAAEANKMPARSKTQIHNCDRLRENPIIG
jgi:transposase